MGVVQEDLREQQGDEDMFLVSLEGNSDVAVESLDFTE